MTHVRSSSGVSAFAILQEKKTLNEVICVVFYLFYLQLVVMVVLTRGWCHVWDGPAGHMQTNTENNIKLLLWLTEPLEATNDWISVLTKPIVHLLCTVSHSNIWRKPQIKQQKSCGALNRTKSENWMAKFLFAPCLQLMKWSSRASMANIWFFCTFRCLLQSGCTQTERSVKQTTKSEKKNAVWDILNM